MSKPFIPKHHYNFIRKSLLELNNTFRSCSDKNIVETTKASIQNKILDSFTLLTDSEKEILNILPLTDPLHIDPYLSSLEPYVYGMPIPSPSQLSKLFKKEKKLKLPSLDSETAKLIYVGWIDEGLKKLFIVYYLEGKLVGMSCRLIHSQGSQHRMCTLCHHLGDDKEVGFVSPVRKGGNDAYSSIGFNICLDSEQCNERMTSTENLEKLLKRII